MYCALQHVLVCPSVHVHGDLHLAKAVLAVPATVNSDVDKLHASERRTLFV